MGFFPVPGGIPCALKRHVQFAAHAVVTSGPIFSWDFNVFIAINRGVKIRPADIDEIELVTTRFTPLLEPKILSDNEGKQHFLGFKEGIL